MHANRTWITLKSCKRAIEPCTLAIGEGIVEFGGGLLVALGLFTVVAAFLASGEMAVAYFKAHAARGFWPIANHGELAVLYCFAFLFIATQGAGAFAVDGRWRGRGAEPS